MRTTSPSSASGAIAHSPRTPPIVVTKCNSPRTPSSTALSSTILPKLVGSNAQNERTGSPTVDKISSPISLTPRRPNFQKSPENNNSHPTSNHTNHPGLNSEGSTTPLRLRSAEASILALESLYKIDFERLEADSQKFFDLTTIANQHLDSISSEMPLFTDTFDRTEIFLQEIAKGINQLREMSLEATQTKSKEIQFLYETNAKEKKQFLQAHTKETNEIFQMHQKEILDLNDFFQKQIQELEKKNHFVETTCHFQIKEMYENTLEDKKFLQKQHEKQMEQFFLHHQKQKEQLEKETNILMNQLETNQLLFEKKIQETSSKYQEEMNLLQQKNQQLVQNLQESIEIHTQKHLKEADRQLSQTITSYEEKMIQILNKHDQEIQLIQEQVSLEKKEKKFFQQINDQLKTQLTQIVWEMNQKQMQIEDFNLHMTSIEHLKTQVRLEMEENRLEVKKTQEDCQNKAKTLLELNLQLKNRDEEIQVLQEQLQEQQQQQQQPPAISIDTCSSSTNSRKEIKLQQQIYDLEKQNINQKNQLKQMEEAKKRLENQLLQLKSSSSSSIGGTGTGTGSSQQMILISMEEMAHYKQIEQDLKHQQLQQQQQQIPTTESLHVMDASIELKTARETIQDLQRLLERQANDFLTMNKQQDTLQKENQDLYQQIKVQDKQFQFQEEKMSIQQATIHQLESTIENLKGALTASTTSTSSNLINSNSTPINDLDTLLLRRLQESSIGIEYQKNAQLLEVIAERDQIAINLIYKTIRSTTDLLGLNDRDNSEILLHQGVLNLVKELKTLKELLITSLEQTTQQMFPSFPCFVRPFAQAETSKEYAIEFLLASHRKFMSHVMQTLTQSQLKIQQIYVEGIQFLHVEKKLQEMVDIKKMLSTSQAELESLNCKLSTQENYLRQFDQDHQHVSNHFEASIQQLQEQNEVLKTKVATLQQDKENLLASRNSGTSSLQPTATTPVAGANAGSSAPVRPDYPKISRVGSGVIHKEHFVNDLEKETGQRISISANNANNSRMRSIGLIPADKASQLEKEFRALDTGTSMRSINQQSTATAVSNGGANDQSLWYQGARILHGNSFLLSVFHAQRQNLLRVEAFNSDTDFQQTLYVTIPEVRALIRNQGNRKTEDFDLNDSTLREEILDVLFSRFKVHGNSTDQHVVLSLE